jgi:hypothetical protein
MIGAQDFCLALRRVANARLERAVGATGITAILLLALYRLAVLDQLAAAAARTLVADAFFDHVTTIPSVP